MRSVHWKNSEKKKNPVYQLACEQALQLSQAKRVARARSREGLSRDFSRLPQIESLLVGKF